MNKPLDNEYRRRWIEFHLGNKVQKSTTINWRDVEWNKVTKLVAVLENNRTEVTNKHKNFKFFMNLRWYGKEAQYVNQEYTGHKIINLWTIGWTDGVNCYLKDIDFYTGKMVKEYVEPLQNLKNHIHDKYKKWQQ